MTSWEILLGGEPVIEIDARLRTKLPAPRIHAERDYVPLPAPIKKANTNWRSANLAKARAVRAQQLKEKNAQAS